MADLTTFIPVRKQPTGPVETFSGAAAGETVDTPMETEDAARHPAAPRAAARARRADRVAGLRRPQEPAGLGDRRLRGALAWHSEAPEELWIGHRERPNEPAARLLLTQAGDYPPGGHAEGFPDTFKRALPRGLRRGRGRRAAGRARLPDLRRRPRRGVIADAIARSHASSAGWTSTAVPQEVCMKLGLLTAAFPTLTLDEIADWAAANGFETLEVACWPAGEGAARRYAGVCHIDVDTLDDARAREITAGSSAAAWRSRRSPTTRTRCRPTPRRARPRTTTCAR